MSGSDLEKLFDIPEIFYYSNTNSPFENCLICNKNLAKPHTAYSVIKAFRYYKEFDKKDVIYELALCSKCHNMLTESYSEESMERLDKYWANNFDYNYRYSLFNEANYNLEDWIAKCACKGKHWKETKAFHIYGNFISTSIKFDGTFPYMLSDEVMEDFLILLSNVTIDSLIKLFDIYTDFPPEYRSIFSKRLIKK